MILATHCMHVVNSDRRLATSTNSLRMKAPTGAKPGLIKTINDYRSTIMSEFSTLNLPTDRVLIGMQANWSAETKWVDRDGLPIPPTPKLVLGMRTILRRWLDNIIEHPLPDVDELNASVPKPWPTGLNGQEEPPYAMYYVVYSCDPQTGALYTFANKTLGSKIAYERLEDQVSVMRAQRGPNVVPVVLLDQLLMKTTNFGMKPRPHFKVIDFKVPPGSGAGSELPQSPTPLLSGAAGAAAAPKPDTSAALASSPSPDPEITARLTLDQMKSAKPVTVGEMINDELPNWA